MKIFKDNAPEYIESGYQVTPLSGKQPVLKEWQKRDVTEEEIEKYSHCNIGLVLGPSSGITALDIDAEDKDLINRIKDIILKYPFSECAKMGKKGFTVFYKYSGIKSKKILVNGKPIIEILSEGNQTVLPPSIHPETKRPYQWHTIGLLEPGLELPVLSQECIDDFDRLKKELESDSSRTAIESPGRNSRLTAIAQSRIYRGESIDSTVDELYKTDLEHDIPYFSDKSERMKYNPRWNAYLFYHSQLKSLLQKEDIPFPIVHTVDTEFIEEPVKKKRIKLYNLRGVMQDIFQYIYDTSPIKRSRFCHAASLSIMSAAINNSYSFKGTLPNMYCMIVGYSGAGKNRPMEAVYEILSEAGLSHLIGDSQPSSDAAIVSTLTIQRERIDVVDEASMMFGAIADKKTQHTAKMGDVYSELWSRAGKFYGGRKLVKYQSDKNKMGMKGKCYSPFISLLTAMTPDAFERCVSQDTMATGFGNRFLFFFESDYKDSEEIDYNKPIPENIIETLNTIGRLNRSLINLDEQNEDQMAEYRPPTHDLKMTQKATEEYKKCFDKFNEMKRKYHKDKKLCGIYNRALQQFHKLIVLDTISMAFHNKYEVDPTPMVKLSNVEWAFKTTVALLELGTDFVSTGVHINQYEGALLKVLEFIKSRQFVTKSDLGKKFNEYQRIRSLVDRLIENDDIKLFRAKINGSRKESACYCCTEKYASLNNLDKTELLISE